MIAFGSFAPASLVSSAKSLAVGPPPDDWRPASALRDPAVLAEVLAIFGRRFRGGNERAILSYWTQFYFAALIIPAATALIGLRRELPVAMDAVRFHLCDDGGVDGFWLDEDNESHAGGDAGTVLIQDHLVPFIDACAGFKGLSRRILWCNAAAMFAYVVHEFAAADPSFDVRKTEAHLREGAGLPRDTASLLFPSFSPASGAASHKRRVCCLRFKLPGVAGCGAICPIEAGKVAAPGPRSIS